MKYNKTRQTLSGVMILSLAGSMLAACGGKETAEQTASVSPSAAIAVTAEPKAGGKASQTPITLSIHFLTQSLTFDDNWAVFKKAAELTNVSLKGTIPASVTDRNEAFNIMMASGNISDIVLNTKVNLEKFGQEGAFVPLNDLIDQHAPHIKKFLEGRPGVKAIATAADGKIYFLPFVPDGEAASGWFIRNDWLEKLGLEMPKTVDDYYKVLKAFKEKDPNGNGKADEIPYFDRNKNVYGLLALWGTQQGYFMKDGKIAFGPLEPEYKAAMGNLSSWYKEGLIDKEIFTRGGKARDILLGDDIGGSTRDWFASTASFNDTLKDKIPGISFIPFAPPADINGKVIEYSSRPVVRADGWGMASSNKHQVETIKYFDFWFSPEGRILANYGLEGVTYTMVDGKPRFKEDILKGTVTQNLWKYGAQLEFAFHQDFEYERQYMSPVAQKGVTEYLDKKYINPPVPALSYTAEEETRLKNLEAPINTYVSEMGQKWVLGAEGVDSSYEAFAAKLKSMGIDEIIKIKNDAYARYLKR